MISEIQAIVTLLNPDFSKLSILEPAKQELVAYAPKRSWTGMASWYGVGDGYHGKRAANGSYFNAYGLTAAHWTLPFGTKVLVTNLDTNASVVVTITDRGGTREIDLSYGAARAIGGVNAGVFPVRLEIVN